ncbi:MAG: outer membrane protein assembly factor BamD, partial [Candidatus Omnitrophota bacterium]
AAIAEFKEIAEENPGAELSENAKKRILELREKESENNYIIAKFYEKQKNYQSAKIYYRIVVDEYPNSKFSKKALTRMQTLAKFE